jgi:hypothetical protein
LSVKMTLPIVLAMLPSRKMAVLLTSKCFIILNSAKPAKVSHKH